MKRVVEVAHIHGDRAHPSTAKTERYPALSIGSQILGCHCVWRGPRSDTIDECSACGSGAQLQLGRISDVIGRGRGHALVTNAA